MIVNPIAATDSTELNIPDLINDFLVEVRNHGGFANDKNFDRTAAEVFREKIHKVLEECAKVADAESDRLGRLSDAHEKAGNNAAAFRFSSSALTAAVIGRSIRELAKEKA